MYEVRRVKRRSGRITIRAAIKPPLYINYFQKGSSIMLYTIIVILLILWLVGLIGHIGGALINLLLVVALIVFIYNLIVGRRAKL